MEAVPSMIAVPVRHRWARPAGARLVCGLAVLAVLALADQETRALRRMRHEALPRQGAYSPDVPPLLTFVNVALGGFRGVLADLLWLRASRLQEAGRFVELVQLADWIAALRPESGEIWAYHAWNLAYNISVMMSRPEDRWRWVQAGMELLRVQGMRRNPANAQVRRELAWFFQHKLGSDMDAAANHYRTEWARMVASYLEPDGAAPEPGSLNAAELHDVFGLDAAAMQALERRFGPLDWRVPGSHAVYWAMEGLRLADDAGRLSCLRIAYQSLALMVRGLGRLTADPLGEDFVFAARPNLALLEGVLELLEETLERYPLHGVRMLYSSLLMDGVGWAAAAERPDVARERYDRALEILGTTSGVPSFEAVVRGETDIDWTQFF